MFEKVNPAHPDKVADRIAGAIVDLAYKKQDNPKVAVEVLIGHGKCHIIAESSVSNFSTDTQSTYQVISDVVNRISGETLELDLQIVPQDVHLADNQKTLHCGDNGIFKGVPITAEEIVLTQTAYELYKKYNSDGKYIIHDGANFIICQSNASTDELKKLFSSDKAIINPLGDWTGGIDVDTGATNRKLGSDMGEAVTGGGIHGKDLSKADVSVNIYCQLRANTLRCPVEAYCAIGNETVKVITNDGVEEVSFIDIVESARKYIISIGGFEKLAEWGIMGPINNLKSIAYFQ